MAGLVPLLLIIWLVGLLISRTGGGLLHLLPIAAVVIGGILLLRNKGTHSKSSQTADS